MIWWHKEPVHQQPSYVQLSTRSFSKKEITWYAFLQISAIDDKSILEQVMAWHHLATDIVWSWIDLASHSVLIQIYDAILHHRCLLS